MEYEQDGLNELDKKDAGVNAPIETSDKSFMGWFDVKREFLPYEGVFFPESYVFQVQPADAATVTHYSSMDESNPLSVQAALTHVVDKHIRIKDTSKTNRYLKPLPIIHETMRFWFAMLVHSYTGNSTSLETTEKCPSCNHSNKIVITPHVIKFNEVSDFVSERIQSATGKILVGTKTYGELEYMPITLKMRAELLAYMQEKYQKKEDFDMQFLSYAPLVYPFKTASMSMNDLYKNVYYPMTQDVKKFSVYTKTINKVALEQLLSIDSSCSRCDHRFPVDIQKTTGLRDIFLDADSDDEFI